MLTDDPSREEELVQPPDANIARRLDETAAAFPDMPATVVLGKSANAEPDVMTFAELAKEAAAFARGLAELGAGPGQRIVLAVKPGREFLPIVFGLFRTGATAVLIDPGMGAKNAVACLEEAEVDGVVGIPLAQVMRRMKRSAFRRSRLNVCVGRRLPGLGRSYASVLKRGQRSEIALPNTAATDRAAIIFTSGSTGPPKGVCYEHGMFDAQWQFIRNEYDIQPGTRDVACFPLFGLFNVAMGVTTIWPNIDYARPAVATPNSLLAAIQGNDNETPHQAFASPAIWKTLASQSAADPNARISVTRALSAGAPVPPETLAAVRAMMPPDATFHTPYGATESLPACTIESREVLDETASLTREGHGTCVGRPFAGVDVAVIRRPGREVSSMIEVTQAATGEIGEVIVRSPAVTREYFNRPDATAASKLHDDDGTFWHRIGDVGYFDDAGRLWFCGRISHIVETAAGPLYPVQLEAVFSQHKACEQCAVVGRGGSGEQMPVLVVNLSQPAPRGVMVADRVRGILRHGQSSPVTQPVRHAVVATRPLPVDSRHNAKIRREQIAAELDFSRVISLDDASSGTANSD